MRGLRGYFTERQVQLCSVRVMTSGAEPVFVKTKTAVCGSPLKRSVPKSCSMRSKESSGAGSCFCSVPDACTAAGTAVAAFMPPVVPSISAATAAVRIAYISVCCFDRASGALRFPEKETGADPFVRNVIFLVLRAA